MTEKIKLRIMLPGGGVKGCFQLGVLSHILESDKFEIDSVYGCSIGAILAPFIANNNIDSLVEVFNNIKNINDVVEARQIFGITVSNKILLGLFAFFKLGAYKSIKLVDQVYNLLSSDEIKIAQEKCHVVSYDILNNVETWFTGEDLQMGIKCSSALWLAVPPISYKNGLYSDGGVTEVFPVTYIIDHDLNTKFDGMYLFIDCDTRKPYINTVPTDGLTLMSYLHWGASLRLSKLELTKLNDNLDNNLVIIRPEINILNNALDINQNKMKQMFDAGILKGINC
jgi:predicted patatin/cPLA2 family phospholipase